MKKLNQALLLYAIIVIEGYVVLSTELLAIRQTIPFVGSGTDTVSIVIAAVLMPLAFGYQSGGRFRPGHFLGRHFTVRKKLIFNIIVAAAILLPGMSFGFLFFFFRFLTYLGLDNRLVQEAVYCVLFLVTPVYLLGQTIPLVSNFFSRERLSKITGRMLFFSTLGSFLGAIVSTLVLMSTIGVHHTVTLNFILLACLVMILSPDKFSRGVILSVMIAVSALYFNSNASMARYRIVKNNKYNTMMVVVRDNGDRHLSLNLNDSSMYNNERRKHIYIEFAEKIAIKPTLDMRYKGDPKEILVIGAGGFTFGHEDTFNHYTFVDIDKDLKDVAEKYILKEPIGENKKFEPIPARAFLYHTDKKYDVIFLDAYLGGISIPEHLVTREFFQQIKDHLNDKGLLLTNFIVSPNFTNVFSRNVDNTIRSVFPHVSRYAIDDFFQLWSDSKSNTANVSYIYRHETDYDEGGIYTDDKNTVYFDVPKRAFH